MIDNRFVSPASWFGRSRKELDELVAALSEARLTEHNVLNIGPGCSVDDYCFEPIELSAALDCAKKPWKITVMDYNPHVCNRLMTQETLPINRLMVRGFLDYVEMFLGSLGYDGKDIPDKITIPQKFRERMTVVQCDLSKPESFPNGDYNVIVALNVLYYLSPAAKTSAINALASKMPSGGVLLSDFTIDNRFKLLKLIPWNERADKRVSEAYISVKI